MSFELYIAGKLKTKSSNGNRSRQNSQSLTIAVFGITLAIIIMILSITIVCGFKQEISNKIYNLDSHIKIKYIDNITSRNSYNDITKILTQQFGEKTNDISIIADKSAILKTNNDFKGVIYKGVDNNYNWEYLKKTLIEGRIPDSTKISEIIISQHTANKLKISVGQKIHTYFIENGIKVRNLEITGIYNTDLPDFDNTYILGNIKQLHNLGTKSNNTVNNYIGINCKDVDDINFMIEKIHNLLNSPNYKYNIYSTTQNNASYFTWLKLLDMNVIIIIIIMLSVSAFTLISAMLMIVLERTNTIGLLKALGCGNNSIRKIFIYLTSKLIFKSLLWGNIIGIGLSYIQQQFHIIKLNAEAYYISHVPVAINWYYIILFNIGIILIAYISLLTPSKIISTIQPHKSIKFE